MDMRRILWVAAAFVLVGAPAARPATIWIEGEKPARHTMNRHPWWYDKVKRGQLSAGDWISNFSKEKTPHPRATDARSRGIKFPISDRGEGTVRALNEVRY